MSENSEDKRIAEEIEQRKRAHAETVKRIEELKQEMRSHRRPIPGASLVMEKLWVGSVFSAKDNVAVESNGITHVLTMAGGLTLSYPPTIQHKVVDILDMESEDILKHIPECVEFIEKGREAGGVLVHCQAGVSRSVSAVIAYLVRHHKHDVDTALDLIQSVRSFAGPNSGFMRQLRRYEQELKSTGVVDVDALASTLESLSSEDPGPRRYRCRLCGHELFDENAVVKHASGEGQSSFAWRKRDRAGRADADCTSIFIDVADWMGDLSAAEGRIVCSGPRCSAKIGSFAWSGMQCSCGHWVTPAFQILRSKVDESVRALPTLQSQAAAARLAKAATIAEAAAAQLQAAASAAAAEAASPPDLPRP
eukprot:tig00000632_g2744.t1